MKKVFATLLAIVFLGISSAHAAMYSIDQSHTTIGFSVAHLVITKTKGAFDDYTGQVTFDPSDLSSFSADMSIQVASIDTNNVKRDDHLRSADFFDAAQFPTIDFVATGIKPMGDDYVIMGDLTMKGITKAIELPVTISGPVTNPFGGGQVLGLEGIATIDRKDWGITWNRNMDNGGLVVGEDVELQINMELHSK